MSIITLKTHSDKSEWSFMKPNQNSFSYFFSFKRKHITDISVHLPDPLPDQRLQVPPRWKLSQEFAVSAGEQTVCMSRRSAHSLRAATLHLVTLNTSWKCAPAPVRMQRRVTAPITVKTAIFSGVFFIFVFICFACGKKIH